MDKYDPKKLDDDDEAEAESGSEEKEDEEEEESSDESEPLTPSVLPMEDGDGDELTGAEEKVLNKLRKQRSDYDNDDQDKMEKAGMNGKNPELSPLDHWSSAPLGPPPAYESAASMPLSSTDHWSQKADKLSNEEPPPDANGMKTTSFIDEPRRYNPRSRSYLPSPASSLAAPIASGEEELTDAEVEQPRRLKPALKPPRPVEPGIDEIELRNIQLHDMERAEPPEEEEEAYECTGLGWFNCCGTLLVRVYSQLCTANSTYSCTKRILGILAVLFLIAAILLATILPPSFEFVNYYNFALKKSRFTGVVDRETVIYPGCYVLGPDVDLVLFDSTAHIIDSRVSVFTSDKLVIDVDISMQYFLRPEEVGKLYTKFAMDYRDTLEALVYNSIKNEGTKHSLDTYRLDRSFLENKLFMSVRERLGGNCCPSCCQKTCVDQVDKMMCYTCKPAGSCDEGYHVDVDYFQMGRVIIPNEVFERYMRQTILLIENDREAFIQEHAVVQKKTSRDVQQIRNDAAEVRANATAYSETIQLVADAEKETTVQLSYVKAWKRMFSRLNFTQEDHKTSLMLMRAYEDIKDNLYSYGFEKDKLVN